MTSKLGQFITSKKSWTLPDTRPQNPVIIRSKLSQLRVSADAFSREAARGLREERQSPLAGMRGRSSRPGGGQRDAFYNTNRGDTRNWAKSRASRIYMGPWDN